MNPYRWTKLGRPFVPQEIHDRPWLRSFAQAPHVLHLPDRLRVYFSCRPEPDARGQFVSYSAWVDLDRQHPLRVLDMAEQPILSLGGLGCFDEFGTYPVSVIPQGDVLRAYYAGWTRCESVPFDTAIGTAVSQDGGKTFQREGDGPLLAASLNEPYVISGPKVRRFNVPGMGQYQLFYIAGRTWKQVDGKPEPVYKIRMAISDDGLRWQRQDRDLIESRIEPDEAQASPDVFESGGRFHMFFCYRYSAGFRGKEKGYRIGYASSSDLLNWVRDDARAGLDVSPEGWDSEMVAYPHVFQVDGVTYLAYLGNGVGREGFGIARLEGDL